MNYIQRECKRRYKINRQYAAIMDELGGPIEIAARNGIKVKQIDAILRGDAKRLKLSEELKDKIRAEYSEWKAAKTEFEKHTTSVIAKDLNLQRKQVWDIAVRDMNQQATEFANMIALAKRFATMALPCSVPGWTGYY